MAGYSDREAAEIIRKAAEKQSQGEPSEGLSLEDLERIAGELGIDPKHVREAAREAPVESSTETLRFERSLPAELDEESWLALVDRMRTKFGGMGTVSQVGGTREWAGLEAALMVTGRKMVLRIDRSASVWSLWIIGGLLSLFVTVGLAQATTRFAGPLMAFAAAAVFAGSAFFGLKWMMRSWVAKNTRAMEAFADSLRLEVEADAPVVSERVLASEDQPESTGV